MQKLVIIAAVVFQVTVLLYMAGQREYILATGQTVYLRTAPIDPRDIFRGDYVRLNYEISSLTADQFQQSVDYKTLKKGSPVYAQLAPGPRELAEFTGISTQTPAAGLFIRGRVRSAWSQQLNIKYGIEAYFVEQGQGLVLEEKRGSRDGIQIPMEMEVALSSSGTAVLKGYRWSPLGIGLEVIRPTNQERNAQQPVSVVIQLTLQNTSEQALALIMLPEYCSFSLQKGPWGQSQWQLAHDPCTAITPDDADVIVLQPQQQHRVEFDFAEPRWQLRVGDELKEIAELQGDTFRLIYQPPAPTNTLTDKELIWQGRLSSRAFNGRGRID